MNVDFISEIKRAEEDANNIIKEAYGKAKDIINDANNEAQKAAEMVAQKADKSVIAMEQIAAEKAKAERQRIIDNATHQAIQIKESGELNIDKAVDYIIERIVDIHGNS